MMSLFGKDRRRKERYHPVATVVFTVRSGKDPKRVSSPVTGTVKDLSPKGMSVLTPRIAPDGLHIMYDNLMVHQNRIDATILPEGKPPILVAGTVAWFRTADSPQGFFLFGMQFDQEAAAVEALILQGRDPASER
jgi:hypothetical protein